MNDKKLLGITVGMVVLTAITATAGAGDWQIIRLTNNSYEDGNPQISGNNIAWWGNDGEITGVGVNHVFLYDIGTSTTGLIGPYGPNTVMPIPPGTTLPTNYLGPQISGNWVVWSTGEGSEGGGVGNILLYNGTSTILLPGGGVNPHISGMIVWRAGSSLYLYDGMETSSLGSGNSYPRIDAPKVVWQSGDPMDPLGTDNDIILYDGEGTSQLLTIGSGCNPQIDGDKVVWQGGEWYHYAQGETEHGRN